MHTKPHIIHGALIQIEQNIEKAVQQAVVLYKRHYPNSVDYVLCMNPQTADKYKVNGRCAEIRAIHDSDIPVGYIWLVEESDVGIGLEAN